MTQKELGPASEALLERINMTSGSIHIEATIEWAKKKTRIKKNEYWWYRRLVALYVEGRIDAGINRTGDIVYVSFQRKKEVER